MRRCLLVVVVLLLFPACGDDQPGGGGSPDAGYPDAASSCTIGYIEEYECGGACVEIQEDVPPFWCSPPCTSSADCGDYLACHPDGYCTPTCSRDEDCPTQPSGGQVPCDLELHMCAIPGTVFGPA